MLGVALLPLRPAEAAAPEFANATRIEASGTASIRMRVPRGRYQTVSPEIMLYTKARYLAVTVQHVAKNGTLTHVWSGIGLGDRIGCSEARLGYCDSIATATSWKPFMKSGDDYVITVSGPSAVRSATVLYFVGLPARARSVTATTRGTASYADSIAGGESGSAHGTFTRSLPRGGVLIGGTWTRSFSDQSLPLTGHRVPAGLTARASCFSSAGIPPLPTDGQNPAESSSAPVAAAVALSSCSGPGAGTSPPGYLLAVGPAPVQPAGAVTVPAVSVQDGVSASIGPVGPGAMRFGWAIVGGTISEAQHGAFALWLTLPTRA